MSSKVYFLPWDRRHELSNFLKVASIFSHVKARNFVAIKIHFGEEHNEGHIKPEYVLPVVKIIREKTAYPFLTDASTIYVGKRSDAYHHHLIANKHFKRTVYYTLPTTAHFSLSITTFLFTRVKAF